MKDFMAMVYEDSMSMETSISSPVEDFHIRSVEHFSTIIIIIIIVIIVIISFMQGIYTYIPETNHVPREYSVSAILSLLFMVSISLVPALVL